MAEFAIDHIHLRSPDPEAAAAFYKDKFGATEIARSSADGLARIDLSIGGGKLFISEIAPADIAPALAVSGFKALDHFGLTIRNMDQVVAELKAKGVTFTMEPRSPRPGISIAFLRAPDGVSVELVDRG